MGRVILHVVVPGLPPTATAQQKGLRVLPNGRPHFFQKSRQRREEKAMVARLREAWGNAPTEEGPVAVLLHFAFPYRASEKRSLVKSGLEIPYPARIDCDNMAKAQNDCIQKVGILKSDAQIAALLIWKTLGPVPYTEIIIRRLAAGEPIPLRELLDGGGGGDERAAPGKEKSDAAAGPEGMDGPHNGPDGQRELVLEGGAE